MAISIMSDIAHERARSAGREQECALCAAHEHAASELDRGRIECPHCGAELDIVNSPVGVDDWRPVGEDNTERAQRITSRPVFDCDSCRNSIGLFAEPVTWNANHDVYYTGGPTYLTEDIDVWTDDVNQRVEQFVRRIKAGESLDAWNLKTWVGYAINSAVAAELHRRGLKK